ncbi:uncharacterized protein LOC133173948 [Saccostrea echinata]|uniref:uncharacterized protein LOC133173948 n=1 Tax=Saccostrea echinata TaxID=191078 RepID=UPI002A8269D2|nr:uncharacterized protein LOC133173948 [Saccostrea echinata]
MNPAIMDHTYSFNQGQMGYPYSCTPVPGNYNVQFPGYGGPYPQPFFGPPQPCSSIPYAYGPYYGTFPPGYMAPQQQLPPNLHTTPRTRNKEMGSRLMRPGDFSSYASDLPATLHHQQQMPTVPRKSPPGFPQILSGEISPAGMQWNTLVSHTGLLVSGISKTEDMQDRDDSEDSSVELGPPSTEHSTAGCQTTPDTDTTSKCKQTLDLTLDTQPSRSDVCLSIAMSQL